MNKYETVMIINSKITDEVRNEVIGKIEKYIKENGNIVKIEQLGIKKLAYEVKEQKEGFYCVIEFETEAENIRELERIYRLTDEILKFIVIKKED